MSEKCYRFVLPSGEYEDRFLRNNEDAIDFAKEDFDGISCVIIQREVTEYHDIGTIENGVFTAATQESTLEDELLNALEKLRGSIRHSAICRAPQAFRCSCDADQLWHMSNTLIAKAKGGAK